MAAPVAVNHLPAAEGDFMFSTNTPQAGYARGKLQPPAFRKKVKLF
jgi:hypothetical protein